MHSLQQERLHYRPTLPESLASFGKLVPSVASKALVEQPELAVLFPSCSEKPFLCFKEEDVESSPLSVGVFFSGGTAPGGHNVIAGLFDALKAFHPESLLLGFLNGPAGLLSCDYIDLVQQIVDRYRNQGGFNLIGSGRTKIETVEQFAEAENTARKLNLDGIVVIGGDDSNTNAALLAEYFIAKGLKTSVIGVPKTIDGDLKNQEIAISFGFDTATKVYSEIIGNIACDAFSARKYYHFIKLMGRSASHVILECALQVHPNYTIIGEEVAVSQRSLQDIVKELSDLIVARSEEGKDYGVILVPEGLLEFTPECKSLIEELNLLLQPGSLHSAKIEKQKRLEQKIAYAAMQLSPESKGYFESLPVQIQLQLLNDRDPHGNVQVSKIETERLLIEMVEKELNHRKKNGQYQGKFSAQSHFCGYEGRACLPSNFDAQYCFALGHVAALLIRGKVTGYIAAIKGLALPVEKWEIAGVPLVSLMHVESRFGKLRPVIRKALLNLEAKPFKLFQENREEWALKDDYCFPGPIQYFGPPELTEAITLTLKLEGQ